MAPKEIMVKKLPTDLQSSFTPTQIELVKSTIAKGATDDELLLFLYTAKRTGLDPLTKQIHFVKRNQKKKLPDGTWIEEGVMTVQTGIDGYRAIADRTGQLAGIEDAIFDSEEENNPKKATVTVTKIVGGHLVKYTASARWSEYVVSYKDYKTGAEKLGPMWAKMPYLMLAKCAEALALRKAFPNDLSGLYTNEEMQQADVPAQNVAKPIERVAPVQQPQEVQDEQPAPKDDLPTVRVDEGEMTETELEAAGLGDPNAVPAGKGLSCACGVSITQAEYNWSTRFFGQPLCRTHQAEVKRTNQK